MKTKKIVEIPTGITTKICTNLEGRILVSADTRIKEIYKQNPAYLKPIQK